MYGTLNTAIKIGTYHATHTNDANCKTIVASGVYNAIIKFSDDTILDFIVWFAHETKSCISYISRLFSLTFASLLLISCETLCPSLSCKTVLR